MGYGLNDKTDEIEYKAPKANAYSAEDQFGMNLLQLGMGQGKPADMSQAPPLQGPAGGIMGPAGGPPLPSAPNIAFAGLMTPQQSSVGMPPAGPVPGDISGQGRNTMVPPNMQSLMGMVGQPQKRQQLGDPGSEFKASEYLRGLMYG